MALLGIMLATTFAPSAAARTETFQALAPSAAELTAISTDPGTSYIYAQENGGTSFFRYDPRANSWSKLAPSPLESGNNGGAAYLGGKIYIVYTGNEEEIAVYDIGANSWATIENPLNDGTANITSTGGKLYLAVEREFVSIDPATENVTPLADPPVFTGDCDEGFEKWGGLVPDGGKIFGHQGNGCFGFAVYDIATDSWQELPSVPGAVEEEGNDPEGAVAGSAIDPITNTYLTSGPYPGKTLFRYDIEAGTWSTGKLPFEVEDNGMVYLSLPGLEGVYMIQGEEGVEFTRYTERNVTDLAPAITSKVARNGKVTYWIQVRNNGPERAGAVVLSNPLPPRTTLLSAASSHGTCAATTVLTCNLGALPSGVSAGLTVQLKARTKTVSNSATVSSLAIDSALGNNTATNVAKQCVVPKLRNRPLKKAKKALRRANCKPGKKAIRRYHKKKAKGRVIRSRKPRGKLLPAGSRVKLVVSRGAKNKGKQKSKGTR